MLKNFWGDFLEKLKQYAGRGSKMDCLYKKKSVDLIKNKKWAQPEVLLKEPMPVQIHWFSNHWEKGFVNIWEIYFNQSADFEQKFIGCFMDAYGCLGIDLS